MTKRKLPDIAKNAPVSQQAILERVGMSGVEVPIRVRRPDGSELLSPGLADAYVSLDDPKVKGIHMSRLYLSLQDTLQKEVVSFPLLETAVWRFVESHKEMSQSAYLRLQFSFMTLAPSLMSQNVGWRTYPVAMECELKKDGSRRFALEVKVSYSSTCPCSAALARQLISERFLADHQGISQLETKAMSEWLLQEESVCATPHSQRSEATVKVELSPDFGTALEISELIGIIESSLGTAVQAAVKREDEQEFARLNGLNLMFCEDAARKLRAAIEADQRIVDYRLEAKHMESLHPHNAVSVVTKGVEGGYRP